MLKDRKTLRKKIGYLLAMSMIVMRNLIGSKEKLIFDVEILVQVMILKQPQIDPAEEV